MSLYYLERRKSVEVSSLSWDLARHLYTRQLPGQTVIVTERPAILLSPLKKHWKKITRRAMREKASSIDAAMLLELTEIIAHMQRLHFTVERPDSTNDAVFFTTADELLASPYPCHTLYVTCNQEADKLHHLGQSVERHGLLVTYPQQ